MSKLYTCTKCGKKKQENEFPKGYKGKPRSWCKSCCSIDNQERYQQNSGERKESRKEYYQANRDVELSKMKDYYKENKDKFMSYSATRRAKKYNACPNWLSPKHKAEIKSIYKMCRSISKKTTVQHHVDHIVPLQGEKVSGLHVPWNLQIIPASKNLSKHNSFDEDMVCSSERSED